MVGIMFFVCAVCAGFGNWVFDLLVFGFMRRLRGTAHFMERDGVDSGLVWDWWLMKSSVWFFCGASRTIVFIGCGGVAGISRLWVSRNWHIKGSRLSARVGAVSCICFINAVMTVA